MAEIKAQLQRELRQIRSALDGAKGDEEAPANAVDDLAQLLDESPLLSAEVSRLATLLDRETGPKSPFAALRKRALPIVYRKVINDSGQQSLVRFFAKPPFKRNAPIPIKLFRQSPAKWRRDIGDMVERYRFSVAERTVIEKLLKEAWRIEKLAKPIDAIRGAELFERRPLNGEPTDISKWFSGIKVNGKPTLLPWLVALVDALCRYVDDLPARDANDPLSHPNVKADPGQSKLRPCALKAMSQYRRALEENPQLRTDRDAYDWFREHLKDDGEAIPSFATWVRSLRRARAASNSQKNKRGGGHETRSVVSAEGLDPPKRTKADRH